MRPRLDPALLDKRKLVTWQPLAAALPLIGADQQKISAGH
jgi:hypothetical protein